jgi:exopolyphosphatase/guanosine-5'-triphosphate,3'-diphosphate pyrophosphatase
MTDAAQASPARRPRARGGAAGTAAPRFAAIDLGTNNCRLLVAAPTRNGGFRVVDAFSRIVRLGEGLGATGRLSEAAMARTIEALKVCAAKMRQRRVTRSRAIATQACRLAANGPDFLREIEAQTGLAFDLITPEEEAALAARGCSDLIEDGAPGVLVFDIGGGSTEMSWIRREGGRLATEAWTSFPFGVVTLAEKHAARDMDRNAYEAMVAEVAREVAGFAETGTMRALWEAGGAHLIGTSGTVTSLAGVKMRLPRYTRRAVDGAWLTARDVAEVSEALRVMGFDRRCAEPCIGPDRADLVVPGCAILEGIMRVWPSDRVRVGDRGLREGMLLELMAAEAAR